MKKINFSSIANVLSREEMKNITGGSSVLDSCNRFFCSGPCKKNGISGRCLSKANLECVCGTATVG